MHSHAVRLVVLGFAMLAVAPASRAQSVAVDKLPPVDVSATRPVPDKYLLPGTTAGVTAEQMEQTINVVNVEDALKYLPSIVIRKRHIGDVQAPIQTRTSGLGQSARSLIFADGVLLSALIGNNNGTASPRWGMVTPAEIDRIDVMYGPFAAGYAGNSIGTVVEITTRMPKQWEASAGIEGATQNFAMYGTRDTYGAASANATLGSRIGAFSYWLSAAYTDSRSQPLAIVTATQPSTPSSAGTPVAGAYADQNRSGVPIVDIGAGGFEHQQQGNYKLKLAYDFTPTLRAIYTVGMFQQNDDATVQSYITDAAGNPVYSGNLNIFGYNYNVPASAFSNNFYRLKEDLVAQSLVLRSSTEGTWDWEAIVSNFDFHNDILRTPTVPLPAAQTGGAGIITSMDGTGWWNADFRGIWRPQGPAGSNQMTFGAHYDRYALVSPKYLTDNWMSGGNGALSSDARGKTRTEAIWLQDLWRFAPDWTTTLGARYEWWRAYDGYNFSLAPPLSVNQPALSAAKFSPKAALAWQVSPEWSATGLFGVAYRFPTVTELYQVVTTGPTLTVPNPFLKPEHAVSGEIALERALPEGQGARFVFPGEPAGRADLADRAAGAGVDDAVQLRAERRQDSLTRRRGGRQRARPAHQRTRAVGERDLRPFARARGPDVSGGAGQADAEHPTVALDAGGDLSSRRSPGGDACRAIQQPRLRDPRQFRRLHAHLSGLRQLSRGRRAAVVRVRLALERSDRRRQPQQPPLLPLSPVSAGHRPRPALVQILSINGAGRRAHRASAGRSPFGQSARCATNFGRGCAVKNAAMS